MTDIESRLHALEKNNGRLRIISVAIAVFFASSFMLVAAPKKAAKGDEQITEEIKTRRVVIVDDEGVERIILEVAERKLNNEIKSDKRKDVFASIRLLDSDGNDRASLDASDGGLSRLKLFNAEGKRRIEIVTAGDNYAKMLVYDKNGKEEIDKFP